MIEKGRSTNNSTAEIGTVDKVAGFSRGGITLDFQEEILNRTPEYGFPI